MNNALTQYKPFHPITYTSKFTSNMGLFFKSINYSWWLIRIPLALIALSAAYGVAQFAGEYVPSPWKELAGWAFESAYIGAIALADQQLDEEKSVFVWGEKRIEYNATAILWYIVNLVAVIASILSNLLFFSAGLYANTTPETLTHAIPLPLLGFFYGLLIHRTSYKAASKMRKEFAEKPYVCECGNRYENVKQLNGHKAQCKNRTKQSEAAKPKQGSSNG